MDNTFNCNSNNNKKGTLQSLEREREREERGAISGLGTWWHHSGKGSRQPRDDTCNNDNDNNNCYLFSSWNINMTLEIFFVSRDNGYGHSCCAVTPTPTTITYSPQWQFPQGISFLRPRALFLSESTLHKLKKEKRDEVRIFPLHNFYDMCTSPTTTTTTYLPQQHAKAECIRFFRVYLIFQKKIVDWGTIHWENKQQQCSEPFLWWPRVPCTWPGKRFGERRIKAINDLDGEEAKERKGKERRRKKEGKEKRLTGPMVAVKAWVSFLSLTRANPKSPTCTLQSSPIYSLMFYT